MRRHVRKKYILTILAIILVIIFRNKIINIYSLFKGSVNFKMVEYKANIYKKAIDFREKVEIVSNGDKCLENIKDLQIKLQKGALDSEKIKNLQNENENLRRTLDLAQKLQYETIAADVILSDVKDDGIIYISKGSSKGIKLNQVVIYNGIMIGKITKVAKDYSEVTLLTSKNSKIGVVVNNDYIGILRGNGNGTFSIKNFNSDIDINKNNIFELKTSGLSDYIIQDIPLGTYIVKNKHQFLQTKELNFSPSYDYANVKIVLIVKEVK